MLLDLAMGLLSKRWPRAETGNRANRACHANENETENNDSAKRPGMKTVAQLLSPENVLLDLDVSTKNGVFEEVGRLFERRHGILRTEVVNKLTAREELGSTGLGQGVAIPHARIKDLPRALAAFVRLKLPIPFDAPDAKPVSDMLILLVPQNATEQHLQMLAEFAQMFSDRRFREQIRVCADAGAVCQLFSDWPQS